MSARKTLEDKIKNRIQNSCDSVFMLDDFIDLSNKTNIIRVLRKLINENFLVKVGYGLYAKARISTIRNEPVPDNNIHAIAIEALKKLNIEVFPSKYEELYNKKLSTQIPTGRVIAVKSKTKRKIGFDGNYIKYERVPK